MALREKTKRHANASRGRLRKQKEYILYAIKKLTVLPDVMYFFKFKN